jgi:hypothetical protein
VGRSESARSEEEASRPLQEANVEAEDARHADTLMTLLRIREVDARPLPQSA